MRISDWSSDVCSSDLALAPGLGHHRLLELADELHGVLHPVLQVGRQRPVAEAELAAQEVEPGVHLDHGDVGPVAEQRQPACVLHHRSEEHTSELQSLMRISYAVFCLKKKIKKKYHIQ